MKNRILLAVAICLSSIAHAQEKEWKIAIHVDPNFSWMKPDSKHLEQGDSKLRFGFGIMIDKMFTDNYAFGTGLNIVNMGGQLSYLEQTDYRDKVNATSTPVIVERTRTYNLKYAEIPLTLKLRTNEIGYITYWAQVGFGLGINIKAKGQDDLKYVRQYYVTPDDTSTIDINESARGWKVSDFPTETLEEDDVKDDIAIFRTSLIIGGGIEYNLSGNVSLLAGITFNNGFNNVLSSEGIKKDAAGNPDILNISPQTFDLKSVSNHLSLNVGILF